MNKYEKDLNAIMATMENQCNQEFKDILHRFNSIKKLVERATPKKVKNVRLYNKHLLGDCSCNNTIIDKQNYCDECGQALKWSDEE